MKTEYLTPEEALAARLKLNLSQTQFAHVLGTSTSCVNAWESGTARMHRGLAKLAYVLASSANYRRAVAQIPKPNPRVIALQRAKQ